MPFSVSLLSSRLHTGAVDAHYSKSESNQQLAAEQSAKSKKTRLSKAQVQLLTIIGTSSPPLRRYGAHDTHFDPRHPFLSSLWLPESRCVYLYKLASAV